MLFQKQVDNLKTNHRGVYVLTDSNLPWFKHTEISSKHTTLICGILQGALSNLGISSDIACESTGTNCNLFSSRFVSNKDSLVVPSSELFLSSRCQLGRFSKMASKTPDYQKAYQIIKEFRAANQADVDIYGCAICSDYKDPHWRYHILTALQLSSQTRDPITFQTMQDLKAFGLNPRFIAKTKPEELNPVISKVGFHRKKTQYMISTAQQLVKEHDSKFADNPVVEMPNDIEDILSLPGIGPKMAHLFMQEAWDIPTGIGVDTHVHRVSNRLGWIKTKSPEETRIALEKILPRAVWKEFNPMMVGFGQLLCKPVNPNCRECPASKHCKKVGVKVKNAK